MLEIEGELVWRGGRRKISEKAVCVVGVIINKHFGFGMEEKGRGRIVEGDAVR